MLAYRAIG
ncbi:hypothetical protein DGo_PA0107 (plasmid) [Deinococcus gobiensis I-0]|uniref:Uncharacterized protein n=1 Tax=Deinococcus gobiensis (strain DSM 21396 / JCM 16679 / CGMCC 1.7299 / I-0) TaxID=745776 RepID=H8H0X4_DEIGI|nr:hypothetical protein DGo_PA0107 [Deinococcus gobiensis I-0]